MSKQKDKEKYEVLSVKIKPDQAVLLDAICNVLGVNTYQIFQMFFYTLCKASAPMHELSPEIRKLMTLLETDASWAEAFNLANPDNLKVSQVILILEQEGHKGFGAVMIDKPFMSEARMTECVDDIFERTCEVTMHGIYRRVRLYGARLGCDNLSDTLLTLVDGETIALLDEEARVEMKGEALYDYRGRKIDYGKKTKAHHHRTPDSVATDLRIKFDNDDAMLAEEEATRDLNAELSKGDVDYD